MEHFHIVNFSGGVTSWVAAKRVVERYGSEGVTLITADTRGEADDWHDFVVAAADDVGAQHHVFVHNEKYDDIYDLATKRKYLPNSMAGICSIELKVKPIKIWIDDNGADGYIQYFGFDWSEIHRLDKLRAQNPNRDAERIQAPLMWEPMITKRDCMELLKSSDLPMPQAYVQGFEHNNCLATGCFKIGRKGWLQMMRNRPEVFERTENYELWFRENVNEKGALLMANSDREMHGGQMRGPLLSELRATAERNVSLPFVDDVPCSCFGVDDLNELVDD